MAKILKINEEEVLIGLDDSTVVSVMKSKIAFPVKEGDELDYFTDGINEFVTEKKKTSLLSKVNKKTVYIGGLAVLIVLAVLIIPSTKEQKYNLAVKRLKELYNVKSVSSFKESKIYTNDDRTITYVEGFMEAENKAGTFTTFSFECMVVGSSAFCD